MSSTGSTCSSSKNNSVESVLTNDKVRYKRKGYGLIMAILIFTIYFSLAPIILKQVWPYITGFADRKFMQALIAFIFPQIIMLLGNLMMWWIYVSKIPFFERYRIMGKQWPWEKDQAEWRKTLNKSMKQIFINLYCFVLPSILLDVYVLGSKCRWSIEEFPTSYNEILLQITFMMVVEDFTFYWCHRLLHIPYLYKKIHKVHHEYTNSISISSVYAHPIEYLLGNNVPSFLGFALLGNRAHFATYMMWLAIRVLETIDGHCGYEFSWSPYRLLPLSGSSEYHNYHHSHNVGAYGSFFTFWDTVFGTNKDYFQYKAKKEKENQLNDLRQNYAEVKQKNS